MMKFRFGGLPAVTQWFGDGVLFALIDWGRKAAGAFGAERRNGWGGFFQSIAWRLGEIWTGGLLVYIYTFGDGNTPPRFERENQSKDFFFFFLEKWMERALLIWT